MRTIAISCGLVLLLATGASARVWTDATGTNKVEADFVAVQDGKVILRVKSTGALSSVPLERLSQADQDYLKNLPPDAGGLLEKEKPDDTPKPVVVDTSGTDRFTEAIKQNPNSPDPYLVRAMSRINKGQADDAVADLQKALELDPKNPSAFNEMGRIYMKQGDPAKAHEQFTKAIEANDKFAPAYRNRADNAPAFYKTPAGEKMLAEHESKAHERRDHIAKKYLQKFPWQPPNSTTYRAINQASIQNIINADLAMFDYLEREYRGNWGGWGGGGVAVGGGGVAIGVGDGVAIGDGEGLKLNGALEVYPQKVVIGETVTLVANPSELAKGMPQKLDPNAPRPKAGAVPTAKEMTEIASVDFYRDVNGDGELQKDADEYLASDAEGSDGYQVTVSTAGFTLGNQAYFAVPKGKGGGDEAGGVSTATLTLNENLLRAASKSEQAIADQAAAAAGGAGLSADTADALGKEQARLAKLVNDVERDIKPSAPDVANLLADVRKSIPEASAQLRNAKNSPGAGSKTAAGKTSDAASAMANKLKEAADALAKITGNDAGAEGTPGSGQGEIGAPGSGEPGSGAPGSAPPKPAKPPTPETYAGQPAAASGEITPAPGAGPGGPGGPGGGGPGGPGGDGPDVVNNYFGDDKDGVVRGNDYDYLDDDVVYDRARGHYDDRDYDRAILDYDRLLRDRPFDIRYLRDRAGAYLATGGYDYAIRDYDRMLQVAPLNADFYYNRGCAHQAAGHLNEAVADFTKSIELDELRKLGNLAFNNRGVTYARLSEFQKAIEDFSTALVINPADRLAYHNRGLAYQKLGKQLEADADLQKALELAKQ